MSAANRTGSSHRGSVPDAWVGNEGDAADAPGKDVLHVARDDRVRVAPHKQRRSVDAFELSHVGVPQKLGEHLLPHARRDLHGLAGEFGEQLGRHRGRGGVSDKRPRKGRLDWILQPRHDRVDEVLETLMSAEGCGRRLEHESRNSCWMVNGRSAGDEARARVARDDGSFDAETIEEGYQVGSEVRHPISAGWFVRLAVAALGDRDGPDRAGQALEHWHIGTP